MAVSDIKPEYPTVQHLRTGWVSTGCFGLETFWPAGSTPRQWKPVRKRDFPEVAAMREGDRTSFRRGLFHGAPPRVGCQTSIEMTSCR